MIQIFDNLINKWKYRDNFVSCSEFENKIINTYNNKTQSPKNSDDIMYSDWIHVFDEELLKLKSSSRQPILLFSGGKDSTFIASRMKKNNIDSLYYSLVKNNDEKRLIETLAEKLDIKVHFANHELKHLNFDEIYFNIKEPILDPAGLSVLLLLDINLQNKVNFKDSIFIDGMGNDVYMGHLPGSREIHKMFIQNIFNKMNIHKLFSINMINKFGKFGDLFRPNFMANFPGSNIKLNNYFDLVSYFENIVIK